VERQQKKLFGGNDLIESWKQRLNVRRKKNEMNKQEDQMQLTKSVHNNPEMPKQEFTAFGNKVAKRTIIPDEEAVKLGTANWYLTEIAKCRSLVADALNKVHTSQGDPHV
jgi:hypothetical protein